MQGFGLFPGLMVPHTVDVDYVYTCVYAIHTASHLCKHCKVRRHLAHIHTFSAVMHACFQDIYQSIFVVCRAALATAPILER
jgi:hypothetical protein